jgi:hypothetical protein
MQLPPFTLRNDESRLKPRSWSSLLSAGKRRDLPLVRRALRCLPVIVMDVPQCIPEGLGGRRVADLPSDVVVHRRAGAGMPQLVRDLPRGVSSLVEDGRGGLANVWEVTRANSSAKDRIPANSVNSSKATLSRPGSR